jgi:hypothetical protein
LNAGVRAQVEVKLGWVSDAYVHCSTGRNVPAFADLFPLIGAEEARVVSLLDDYECDARPVIVFQFHARAPDGQQFVSQHLMELTLRYTVAIEDNTVWLKTGRLIELNE